SFHAIWIVGGTQSRSCCSYQTVRNRADRDIRCGCLYLCRSVSAEKAGCFFVLCNPCLYPRDLTLGALGTKGEWKLDSFGHKWSQCSDRWSHSGYSPGRKASLVAAKCAGPYARRGRAPLRAA